MNRCHEWSRGAAPLGLVAASMWLTVGVLPAQMVLIGSGPTGTVRILNTDMAVFEAGDARKDLPCVVTSQKAMLGFDLRFHAGYEVAVPLRELAGSENMLTILFRVSSENRKDEPIYFTQRVRVPAIEEDAKGEAYLQGAFDIGEGRYHVDWLMRDRAERVCSSSWDLDVALPAKDKQIGLVMPPETASASEGEQFKEEPPVARSQAEEPLTVKVLMNFAPQNSRSATLQPIDTNALVSILRSISREPRIGKFSLTAFNMQEQRVLFRQEKVDRLDFPAIGEALSSMKLGTVDLKRLGQKHGETEFLTGLIQGEVAVGHPDALIFAGPKALLEENVPVDALKQLGDLDYPVFYMNYNLYPQSIPWRDSISHAVRFFKGIEYTITKPRDLWYAVSEIVARATKTRGNKRAAVSSTQ